MNGYCQVQKTIVNTYYIQQYTKHGIKLGKKHSQKNYTIINLVEHIDKLSDNRRSWIPV